MAYTVIKAHRKVGFFVAYEKPIHRTCHRVKNSEQGVAPRPTEMKASEADRACQVCVIVSSGRSVAELINIETKGKGVVICHILI